MLRPSKIMCLRHDLFVLRDRLFVLYLCSLCALCELFVERFSRPSDGDKTRGRASSSSAREIPAAPFPRQHGPARGRTIPQRTFQPDVPRASRQSGNGPAAPALRKQGQNSSRYGTRVSRALETAFRVSGGAARPTFQRGRIHIGLTLLPDATDPGGYPPQRSARGLELFTRGGEASERIFY